MNNWLCAISGWTGFTCRLRIFIQKNIEIVGMTILFHKGKSLNVIVKYLACNTLLFF